MKIKLLLLSGLATLFLSRPVSAQQLVNHHANFVTDSVNMWGPSFSPITLDQTITIFDVPWNVNFNTGNSGIFSIAGFDFGGALSGSFSGVIGSEIRIEGFTTGEVDVHYPVDIELDMPTDLSYDQGDNVTIQTSYTVEPGWELETRYPSAGEFFWDLYFRMAAQASAQLCFFGCTTFPIIPAFDTGVQTLNLVTISGSGASTGGTTGVWYLGPADPLGPDQPPAPATGGLFPYAKPPGDASGLVGIDWIPWQVHLGAFPADLPDVGFGLSGSITIPYVETSPGLNGTNIYACGDSTYVNLNVEIFQLIGNILSYVPGPVGVVGEVLSNLSGSQSLGIAEIEWNFFSASFDANITNRQCFAFTPKIYGKFQFPTPVSYTVTNPGGTTLSSGYSSIINMEIGNNLNYKFPCYYDELDITPTYTIDGIFRNHTYDSVSFDFLMSAFAFSFTVPAVTVIPGFTIPSVCFPVPYPCPTWSNPFKWCTTTVCTPEIVVPPIGFPGWSLSVGPLWSTSIPIGYFTYDWFDETWSLEGFTPQTFPAFTMLARRISASATATNVSCFGGSNGAINVTVNQVSPATPYTYTWTSGQTTEDLANIPAGPYEVSIYDANGCQMFTGATVTEPQLLEVSYTKQDKSCGGPVNDGSIDVDVIGGTAPYTYSWNSGQTTQDLAGLNAGTYILTVTDARGCTAGVTVDVLEPNVLGQTGIVSDVNCFNGSDGEIDVTPFGGTLPYAYSWNTTPAQNTEDLSGLIANSYQLTITDGNGCQSVGNYVVAQPATAVSLSITGTEVSCNGGGDGTIDLTVVGGTPGYTFSWASAANGILPYTSEDLTNMEAGDYTVFVTDANGCKDTIDRTITEPALPLSTAPTVVDVLCFGYATGSVDPGIYGGTAPYTFNWSNGATSATIGAIVAGTYTLTVTDDNGCTDTWSYIVKEPTDSLYLALTGVDVLCFGESTGSVTSEVSGGTAPYTYAWSNTAVTPNIVNIPAGTYDLTVTDDHGCTEFQSITIIEPLAPLALSSVVTDVDCHGNNSGAIDLTVTGGTSSYYYEWSNSATLILDDTIQDLSLQYADTYTVLVTDDHGCQETLVQTINEPAAPLAITGIVDDVNCFGISDGNIDATVTGGTTPYTFNWSNGGNTEDLTNIPAGAYTLTVTDLNGCVEVMTFDVNQPAAPLVVVAFPSDVLCNGDNTGAITSEVTGGTEPYVFSWSNGSSTEEIINIPAGIYTLTITDDQGCVAFTGTTVNEPAPLDVVTTITDASCFGYEDGQIVLTVTGGVQPYYFNWGDQNEILLNNPSETLSELGAAEYFIRVTDANGCINEQLAVVNEPALFDEEVFVTDVTCYGANNGAIDLTLTGGTLPYSTVWSDGQTTEDAVNLISGEYIYTVTDAQGCLIYDSVFVAQPDSIDINYEIIPVSCIDQSDASILVATFGGTPPYSYLWTDGSNEENLEGIAPGNYEILITDNYGCTNTFAFEIAVNESECLIIPNTFTPNGDDYNDTWVIGNIELYPNTVVKIFNKWGNEVYSSEGVYVPWDGTFNGNPMPSEVYYYVIVLNNNEDNQYTGNVIIVR